MRTAARTGIPATTETEPPHHETVVERRGAAGGGTGPSPWRRAAGWMRNHLARRRSPLWVEAIFIVWICWIYDDVNNLSPLRISAAMADARSILGFERFLHLDPEAAMDHWLDAHHGLAVVVSNYYDNAHFAVTLTLVGILWWRRPDLYRPLRNSLVLTNLVAMVVFWLAPTAPPRLLRPSTFPDVVASTHAFGSWHSGTLAGAANQFAAMPSLHIGWACWSALALWRMLPPSRWRHLVWIYPAVTSLAVLSTGNHYLADVVAGATALVLAQTVADRFARRQRLRMVGVVQL